ncbi:bifunctional oligoribonuclease/PAP phosphatase NrnA [Rhodococcus rhodnii]|nr:bifunctional oligoribonuclease/PAP phosphatase NrnA [Rhodococcus rhodnii]TXG92642.1 bifunctional oligoribonuclease/PAP phosphatase NrnA [Rhodococcus rhodnii]
MTGTARDVDVAGAVASLDAATSVTVLCHVNPDADTIGSGLALGLAFERRGVPVRVAFAAPDALPESMSSLPGRHLLVPPSDVPSSDDLVVAVDAGSAARLGRLADRLDGARTSLVVDHHLSNTRFADANLVVPRAESTTAVLVEVFDAWGVDIDAEIATCLYAGLVTDTGSFRWVAPGSHALAERLIATGVDAAAMARTLLDTHPFGWLPMLSAVLATATLHPAAAGGRGVVTALVRAADSAGLRPEEIESVVDIVRTTQEAEVAAVFKEAADGTWAVSLRSKSSVDVSAVASRLGGGGHKRAAGYTSTAAADDLVDELVAALD